MFLTDRFSDFQNFQPLLPSDLQRLTVTGVVTFLAYVCCKALKITIIQLYFSVLRDLPGPEYVDSYLWGHLRRIVNAPAAVIHEKWVAEFGPTFQFRGLGLPR
ncbi:hypothetical protein FRB95_011269 [Tulasnella sp. JGI-2019a]|nr:hypothetical protein FRB95_011269 [Tulasnella sp. JGI-2019a]